MVNGHNGQNSPIPGHLSSLIPGMSTFTLAISCLTTSNLLWFMGVNFRFLCNIALYSSDLAFITSHIHNWVLFWLWFHPFIISPVISSSILGTYRPGEFIFQCPIFLPFHTVLGFSRQGYWSGLPFPFPVDHILSDLSTMTRPSWVAPHAWLNFTELDKLWSMWSDWLVVCDCGFSLSALWCPLSMPTVLLGVLLPWMWGISSGLLQQSAATAPYLVHGVAPLSYHPWPWMWGSSSQRWFFIFC